MDDRLAHRAPSAYIAALAACWCALPQLNRYDFHKKKRKKWQRNCSKTCLLFTVWHAEVETCLCLKRGDYCGDLMLKRIWLFLHVPWSRASSQVLSTSACSAIKTSCLLCVFYCFFWSRPNHETIIYFSLFPFCSANWNVTNIVHLIGNHSPQFSCLCLCYLLRF